MHMKAYLLSQGSEIWEITQNAAYVIPEQRTTPLQVEQYNANNKDVNMLFAAVGDVEFERVCLLDRDSRLEGGEWSKPKT